jgi:hypothetical protein
MKKGSRGSLGGEGDARGRSGVESAERGRGRTRSQNSWLIFTPSFEASSTTK